MIKKYFALSLIATSVVVAGCSSDDNPETVVVTPPAFVATPGVGGSAFDFIVNSEAHTNLEAAITAAGLADTLDNPDNVFTIFAPNDSAFAALDADGDDATLTTAQLLEADNMAALTRLLQYHVLSGDVAGATVLADIEAAAGEPVVANTILEDDGVAQTVELTASNTASSTVAINGTDIDLVDQVPADQAETQGRVHVISRLLTPPAAPVVVTPPVVTPPVVGGGAVSQTLADAGTFELFRVAFNADFGENLDTNPWTAFVPSDAILGAAGITAMSTAQIRDHIVASGASDPTALAALTSIQSSSNADYAVATANGVTTVAGFAVELIGTGAGGAQIYSIAGVLTP